MRADCGGSLVVEDLRSMEIMENQACVAFCPKEHRSMKSQTPKREKARRRKEILLKKISQTTPSSECAGFAKLGIHYKN